MHKEEIEVEVIVFGQLVDVIKASTFKLYGVSDTEKLVKELNTKFPTLSTMTYAISVDKKITTENTVLKNKCTVALLPPFSGG